MIDHDGRKVIVNVMRHNVLYGARRVLKRPNLDVRRIWDIKFDHERGIDDGGPSREFFRLLITQIKDSPIFEGPEDNKYLAKHYACMYVL